MDLSKLISVLVLAAALKFSNLIHFRWLMTVLKTDVCHVTVKATSLTGVQISTITALRVIQSPAGCWFLVLLNTGTNTGANTGASYALTSCC